MFKYDYGRYLDNFGAGSIALLLSLFLRGLCKLAEKRDVMHGGAINIWMQKDWVDPVQIKLSKCLRTALKVL